MVAGKDNLTLDRSQRMLRKADFERAFAARCTASDPLLVVYAISNDLDRPRLGMTIGKKHGNAVQRNRLRRLLREAFRLEQHNLPPGFDYLLVPRPIPPGSLTAYRETLPRLTHDAARRWKTRRPR
ncbi:MAG TPA: ribonuclease P protein component [Tepidisphaeraceae bacterium]|nr:ribonuclease P protein component [Tepidisphaeraceae bacterium]